MLSDQDLAQLTDDQRLALAERLAAVHPPLVVDHGEQRRRRFVALTAVAAVLMIPWVVVLAWRLPHRYVAKDWTATWVGFDLLLAGSLALTAWLVWRRRITAILSATVAGALLVCDAWFDILTAHDTRDRVIAIVVAIVIELPLAAVLIIGARRLLHLLSVPGAHRGWAWRPVGDSSWSPVGENS